MKQNKYIPVFEDDCVVFPTKEVEVLAFIRSKFRRVPNEFRETARISIDAIDSHGFEAIKVQVVYARPETDAEEAERERLEAFSVKSTEQREREEYERLKEKYGD